LQLKNKSFTLTLFAQPLHQIIYTFVEMKFLTFILSIYILALNLAPCEDFTVLNNEVKTEISQAFDHDNQDTDLCTPFCICQCCHVNVMQLKLVNVTFDTTSISTQDFFFLTGLEKNFTTSILQPPRV